MKASLLPSSLPLRNIAEPRRRRARSTFSAEKDAVSERAKKMARKEFLLYNRDVLHLRLRGLTHEQWQINSLIYIRIPTTLFWTVSRRSTRWSSAPKSSEW